jgi:hypothetical protein
MVEALEEAAKQSKWVYLTEEEMLDIVDTYGMPLAEAIEAKLRGRTHEGRRGLHYPICIIILPL